MKNTTQKGAIPAWLSIVIIFAIIWISWGFQVFKISLIVSLIVGFVFMFYMFWEKGFFDEYLK